MINADVMQELLQEGEGFGAVFRNVKVEQFDHGLGLSITKAMADFELSLPADLQLPKDAIDFETGQIKPDFEADAAYKDWVNRYLAALLSPEALDAERAKREAFAALSDEAKEDFAGLGLFNYLNEDTDQETLHRFLLNGQFIGGAEGPILLPILSLAKPGLASAPLQISANKSFRAVGKAEHEINIAAGPFDALHALNSLNHVGRFSASFSLSMVLNQPNDGKMRITRAFHETQRVQNAVLPRVGRNNKDVMVAYLPLGRSGRPRGPKETYRMALKPLDLANIDDIWGRIRSYNISTLFKAYVRSLSIEHEGLRLALSESIKSQIETLNESI